jgi:hypothetical protein
MTGAKIRNKCKKQKPTELRYTEKSTDGTDQTKTKSQSSDVASWSDP